MIHRNHGSITAAGCLLALFALSACDPPAADQSIATTLSREAAASPAKATSTALSATDEKPRFFNVTAASGIDWTHNNGAFGERWLPETMSGGLVIFDANGDQRLDLLFINGRNFPGRPGTATTPALYENRGAWTFVEITREAGLDVSVYCLGGAAADYDNDGDADLYLTCLDRDLLFRNDGGTFHEVGKQVGLSTEYAFGAAVVFFDADRDGFLDIYTTRYASWTPETDLYCSSYGPGKSYCTPAIYHGVPSLYYHNRGDGTFEEQTEAAGLYNPDSKALGVVPLDLDQDGWIDLAVACDTYSNMLYHNLGDGRFEDIALAAGIAVSSGGNPRGGMGIDAGYFDQSGRPGLVITYFARDMVGLYKNLGDNFLLDQGSMSAVGRNTRLTLGWGTFFFDYDLDGWVDLFIATGHLDEKANQVEGQGTYKQPQQLFHNLGEGEYREVTETVGGDLAHPMVARGAAFGDLDDDGDLDLVLTTNGGPAKLFENRGEHGNWLRVSLRGTKSNRDGLGAEIIVRANGNIQRWLVHTGGSYLSQSQIAPTFGLGDAESASELEIRWPSGLVQKFSHVAAGQRLLIVEDKEMTVRRPDA